MTKQKRTKSKAPVQGARCLNLLRTGSTLGFFFGLFMGAIYLNFLSTALLKPLFLYWSLALLTMGAGMLCVYALSLKPKHAFGGMMLLASALFSANAALGILPSLGLLEVSVQALAVVAFSLLLYEIGKDRPGSGLEAAGGLIFLGVIFQIVNAPLMEAIGVFLLAAGFLHASGRLARL